MNLSNLTNVEKIAFKWQYGMMGSFYKNLMSAIMVADVENLSLLRIGFPEHVEAYVRFSQEEGWWEIVEKKVKFGELSDSSKQIEGEWK